MANDEMTGNGLSGIDAGSDPTDLTEWVIAARRGLRRDVSELVSRLELGELYVPLAASVPDAPIGEQVAIQEDLTITPHMLVDDEGLLYCALFTQAEILEPLAESLGWTTNDGPLEFCSLPAKVALDLALQVVDEKKVVGLVLNAGHESELLLQRSELASIAQGRAVPLVGYVQHIPVQEFEKTLISEVEEPPPADFVRDVERCVGQLEEIEGFEILTTFNADRDLEPHLTLSLKPRKPDVDYDAISRQIIEALGDELPQPGYVDIVFDRTPRPAD